MIFRKDGLLSADTCFYHIFCTRSAKSAAVLDLALPDG